MEFAREHKERRRRACNKDIDNVTVVTATGLN